MRTPGSPFRASSRRGWRRRASSAAVHQPRLQRSARGARGAGRGGTSTAAARAGARWPRIATCRLRTTSPSPRAATMTLRFEHPSSGPRSRPRFEAAEGVALPAAGFAGSHEPGCRRSLRDGEPTATITAGAYVKWRVAALPCVCDLCAVWAAQLRAEMAGVRVCVRVRFLTAVRFLTEACEETGEFLRRAVSCTRAVSTTRK